MKNRAVEEYLKSLELHKVVVTEADAEAMTKHFALQVSKGLEFLITAQLEGKQI